MKPYYEADGITIYHGRCEDVVPSLPDNLTALLATDPPYFRTIDAEWDDQWGPDQQKFLSWLGGLVAEWERLILDRGTLAVFCSPDLACGVELEIRRAYSVLNHIVWRKPGPGRLGQADKDALRRFFPTSERLIIAEKLRNPDGDLFRFRDNVNHLVAREVHAPLRERMVTLRDEAGLTNRAIDKALGTSGMAGHYFGASQWTLPTEEAWEVISALMVEGRVSPPPWSELRQEFDSRRREFDSRRREFDSRRREFELLSDVWTFDPVPAQRRIGNHPTQKPMALMMHILLTMSREGDLVLDPFMGSGTTLRAAKDLGRKAIGIEMSERYCEVAANRLAQEVLDFGGAA